jgi:hypothetical protein
MAWTEDQKTQVIAAYEAAGPTPDTSTEIIKDLAEEFSQSPNGVRMVLVQAGVYVKKDAAAGGTATKKPAAGSEAPKRVSKEASIAALKAMIEARGAAVDDDVLDKLTGKAAVYFAQVLSA